jgi:hypothetical protein
MNRRRAEKNKGNEDEDPPSLGSFCEAGPPSLGSFGEAGEDGNMSVLEFVWVWRC